MSVLVIAEHIHGQLAGATLATLGAARIIGGDITVLVAGSNCGDAAAQVAKVEGVSRVLLADHAAYEHASAEALTALIVREAAGATHILAAANTFGKNLLPRVAARLDVQPISDIVGIDSPDTFVRPIYAGSAMATVRSADSVKVITARSTAFERPDTSSGNAEIAAIDAAEIPGNVRFVGEQLSVSDRPELASARVIISGGRGMQSGDNFRLLEQIADKLGAAVGASRAAVDAGFAPNDYQVGQTGKIVAPELYIAVGISGAVQHLAGIDGSKFIVAINKDGEAPIFEVADYGLEADLFEALPQLIEELGKAG